MDKYVVSLELAKKLKELGVKQESQYYWCKQTEETIIITYSDDKWILRNRNQAHSMYEMCISAYLTDELLEIANKYIEKFNYDYRIEPRFEIIKGEIIWGWEIPIEFDCCEQNIISDKKLPDGIARMLIYLIEGGKA